MNHNTSTPDSSTPATLTPNTIVNAKPRSRRVRRYLTVALAATTLGLAGATGAGAIVNGEPATAAENPWQVSLQTDGEHFCGGSIVDPTTIVTAAHCTEGLDASDISVAAGIDDLSDASNPSSGAQVTQAAAVIDHPVYARDGVVDLAVIKLSTPLQLNNRVQPIALATADELATATSATVSGWGVTSEMSEASQSTLLSAEVPLIGDAVCNLAVDGIDAASETCAGGTGTDSCYGDSGGPLVIRTDTGPKLAGVVSWGTECGGEAPGVYAEVPTFVDFINSGGTDTADYTPENPTSPARDEFEWDAEFEDDEFEDDEFEYDEFDWDAEFDVHCED